jgi:hypothetical protein
MLKLALEYSPFEERQQLTPLITEYAKASQKLLWD